MNWCRASSSSHAGPCRHSLPSTRSSCTGNKRRQVVSGSQALGLGSPLALSPVHWVQPEIVVEVTDAYWGMTVARRAYDPSNARRFQIIASYSIGFALGAAEM